MKTIRPQTLSDQLSPACGLLLSVLGNKIFIERTLEVFVCLIDWLFSFQCRRINPQPVCRAGPLFLASPVPNLHFGIWCFHGSTFLKLFPPQTHSGKFYFMPRHELSFNWMCLFGGALAHNYPVLLPVPILKKFLSYLFYLVVFCLAVFVCTTSMPATGAGVKDGCDAKNQTLVLCNSNNCSWLLPYLSRPNYNHLEDYSFLQWFALLPLTESMNDYLRTQVWASSCLHCLDN